MGITKKIWNQRTADKKIGVFGYIYIHKDTKVTIKISRGLTEKFQTRREVKQDCVLILNRTKSSPI